LVSRQSEHSYIFETTARVTNSELVESFTLLEAKLNRKLSRVDYLK